MSFTHGGVGTATTTAAASAGVWFFFEGYLDGTGEGTRFNASGSYTTLGGSSSNQNGAFALARNEDAGNRFYLEGAIGYYLEYTRALAADEVQQIYTTLRNIMSARGVALP